jgi:hypothetical protein
MPLRRSRYLWAILDASQMKRETVVPIQSGRPSRTEPVLTDYSASAVTAGLLVSIFSRPLALLDLAK